MKRITLRLPDDVALELEQRMENETRSLNSQIVHMLREHMKNLKRWEKYDKDFLETKFVELEDEDGKINGK